MATLEYWFWTILHVPITEYHAIVALPELGMHTLSDQF